MLSDSKSRIEYVEINTIAGNLTAGLARHLTHLFMTHPILPALKLLLPWLKQPALHHVLSNFHVLLQS